MPEDCAVHEEQIKHLEKSDEDQWDHITGLETALRKLVPIWTTVVLMTMSAITGSALTFAGMILRLPHGTP